MKFEGSLHNHTDYSNIRLRDCIIKVEKAFKTAAELGHNVIGFTDHETISSWIKIELMNKKFPDIKAIRGNEIYLCRNGLTKDNFVKGVDKYYHFILLAKDLIGARQIMEISTKAWMRSYKQGKMRRVPTYYQDIIDIIGKEPGHVIGSTACLGGALPTQILRRTSPEKLMSWIRQMEQIFGKGNFYLEMQPSNNKDQIEVNKTLLEFSKQTGVPYIITTDSHYARPQDRGVHEAYLKSQDGDREVSEFYATTYMMSDEEVRSFFPYFSQSDIEKAFENIKEISDKCENFSLLKPLRIPDLPWKEPKCKAAPHDYFDRIPYLKTFMESDYIGDHRLCDAIIEGIESHLDLQNGAAYNEINSNLEMTWVSSKVNNAHWSAYYLNLQKIIDLCWDAGSLVGPGRGSGVGFILLYVLGITQINPLREKTKTFAWRFLNPDRVSVLDVDFDIEGGRRADVLNTFRQYYGEDRVANVATFRTEKSKSALLTAARGLGIDVDIAQYLASLIPSDRGTLRTLTQCMEGDEENGWAPVKQFVIEMTQNYPQVWEVAQQVEGMICGSGLHAGGVIFVDEPFTESTGLMRAPDGTICTQFELHDCEAASLIKYDALSVEAMDKIHNCLDLLCDYGYVERKATLKETYESVLGIYNIERLNPDMWKMVWNHEIQSLFQMEGQTGIQGIAQLKPNSVDELAILNSTLRLMAQEKGGEMPTAKLARFKENPRDWDREIIDAGLDINCKKILEPILGISYGLCIAQEQFMELVQLPELGGFSLTWADKLRKSIAKKNPKEYDELTKEFYKVTKEKGIDQKFAHYVWDVLIAMSKGYGFNQSHTLAYSLIALQEMNLAYHYPIMFWNCACLITDAGGDDYDEDDEDEPVEAPVETYTSDLEEFDEDEDEEDEDEDGYEEEDAEGYPSEVVKTKDGKKKKKSKAVNYGKIASAIGRMVSTGIKISPPDINESSFTFSPDIEKNTIRYGLSGITRISNDLIKVIMDNRPYESVEDFLNKVKVNKVQMINLLKAGAFDGFGDRIDLMKEYILSISDQKKRITLQNMAKLIEFKLLPDDYDFQIRTFNFNKYLKAINKGLKDKFRLDNIAFEFYSNNFDIDKLFADSSAESEFSITQDNWKILYDKQMDIVRPYIKNNAAALLEQLNNTLFKNEWDKYCLGSISKWEMDSLSCYIHEHELTHVKQEILSNWDNFDELPDTPDVERMIFIKGKQVPIFRLQRIAGTVLDRNKLKKIVTLLTTHGVVTVKIFGGVFEQYDKQISERGADGKKHVLEKSAFSRGNKIIVTGIKQEDSFLAKTYQSTPYHRVEIIEEVKPDGSIKTRNRGEVK